MNPFLCVRVCVCVCVCVMNISKVISLCYSRDWFICVTWLVHMCDMTHSRATRLIHLCDMTHRLDLLFIWLVRMCDMTPSYVWHDSFTCVTWLLRMCDMTHSHVWHDSFKSLIWFLQVYDMTHSYVWHDSFICVTWLIHMPDTTFSYGVATISMLLKITSLFCRISSLLQGSFAKETYNFKEPTSRSHPIRVTWLLHVCDMTPSYI